MKTPQLIEAAASTPARDYSLGLIVDNFAGGGGASTGLEAALLRDVDVAINHDPEAVAMHAANHPRTRHHCQSVWAVDPLEAVTIADRPQPVWLAWFSPDCKHFSKAKGGKPVSKNIRDLAWIVHHWIDRLGPALRPAIIMLENVEEFRTWGPLTDDGRPCPAGKGKTFDEWVRRFRKAGYRVEWRELRACDHGAPTTRKRLFLIARCDGQPIVWPKRTHAPADHPDVLAGRLRPWRTAADIIDWSIPCPSIFTRIRPLKDATCRRIAAGIMRYVIDAPHPFIVPVCNSTWAAGRAWSGSEPLRTITTAKGGEYAVVSSTLVQTGYGEREGQAPRVPGLHKPLGAVVAGGGKHALVCAFMAQHNTMPKGGIHAGHAADMPVSTITGRGTQQNIVTSQLVKLRNNCVGQGHREPIGTLTTGGHYAEVRAFLVKYYGAAEHGQAANRPLDAVTAKARFGLVTVTIAGEEYAIVDIGMRMLTPRELFLAQGFPADYVIDLIHNGKPLTKTAQIRMCGNSVSPVMAEALAAANCNAPAREAIAA
ncbi:DNA (cytosine-5)-methyltransferase 1 [Sphingomonas laterariae]|uniref:DNA (cytosine-5-)-methyltransferase n=1 Tax=Edaphosphingomonas laterariae TaxID=861865 RepID=A0A239FB58_9SPHN|nr:DNA cytosine methyltransferase [Sphingomonas laterariae]SNS53971.1 DNA (cytosine-5)-methyltransferase 1 [Sphingomonas laterariae]